ncbi:hypothetical protein P4Q63_004466 [Salmonella enterica]|nr:hypothetical protein [Salmonella enterica]EJX4926775.1 hypothetical protein [Salmonella enterica]EKQ0892874.1 hypothetical protein [Salmonella enterica]
MSFEDKKERAIAIMESKKMWSSNYAPPLLRALWKIGVKIPPLPFAPFWQITLLMGIWFGPLWGLLMWFFSWRSMGVPSTHAIAISIVAGVSFGVLMAVYHWWRKKVNKLPDWNSLE